MSNFKNINECIYKVIKSLIKKLDTFILIENLMNSVVFQNSKFFNFTIEQNLFLIIEINSASNVPEFSMENISISFVKSARINSQRNMNIIFIAEGVPINITIRKSTWKNNNVGLFEGLIKNFTINSSVIKVNDTLLGSGGYFKQLFYCKIFTFFHIQNCLFIGSVTSNINGAVYFF